MTTSTVFRFLAVALLVCPAQATNENFGFSRTTVAIGTLTNKMIMESGRLGPVDINASNKLDSDQAKEVHSYIATFLPHGHSNWHSHPGPEIDIIPATGSGPIDFYYVNKDGSCRKEILSPGQSHMIMPGEIHVGINESGSAGAIVAVLRIHPGSSQEIPITTDQPQPTGHGCKVI